MAQTSILGRIGQLLRANINAMLDSAEDPEKMLDQLVRDFTNNIAEAEEAVAQTVGNLRMVEDDARVRSFAQQVLTRLGHTVHTFPNGEAAVAALTSLRPAPELLITDVVMPGMNGRVLSERVAAVLPGVRALFTSGYTQNVIVSQGVLHDGIEFLAKPYSVEQLAQRIAQLMEKS